MDKENNIYIVGHKSPDTDTICSAIAYAEYLKSKGIKAVPIRSGEINPETKYVLDRFGVESPVNFDSVDGKKLILVDHNEKSQSPEGIEEATVIEVIDHHKIDFSASEPINFETKPFGATATLIAQRMLSDKDFEITKEMAGILIAAILSDTVIFKSTTTTEADREAVEKLNEAAKIKDLQKFGIDMKKEKSSLKGLNANQIVYSDFKTFEVADGKFGIGQIETADLDEAKERKEELLEEINEIAKKEDFLFIILMLTDIINEGSELLISEGFENIKSIFKKEIKDNSIYIDKMMSRKKDLVPLIMNALNAE